jgi:shikimate kinase
MANLIIVGPQNVGKSTTAHWIARATRTPRLSLDDRAQAWFRDNQPSFKEAMTVPPSDPNRQRLFKLAEAQSVQQCVSSADGTVIDFGAGHSVYDHADHFQMVQSALTGHHVVLLLPSINVEISRLTLHERCGHEISACDLANLCLDNPSNRNLAQVIVYTNGKTPIEVANEVLERLPNWPSRKAS